MKNLRDFVYEANGVFIVEEILCVFLITIVEFIISKMFLETCKNG